MSVWPVCTQHTHTVHQYPQCPVGSAGQHSHLPSQVGCLSSLGPVNTQVIEQWSCIKVLGYFVNRNFLTPTKSLETFRDYTYIHPPWKYACINDVIMRCHHGNACLRKAFYLGSWLSKRNYSVYENQHFLLIF